MIWMFLIGLVIGVVGMAAYYRWLDRRTPASSFAVSETPPPIPPTQYRQRTLQRGERKTATVRRLQIRQRRNNNPGR